MPPIIDLTGERFGKLVVIAKGDKATAGHTRWICQCDCGNQTLALASVLRYGKKKSCGCLKRESMAEVGRSNQRHASYYWRIMWTKHRLTPETFDELVERQQGKCAICGTEEPGGPHNTWNIDHDHRCCAPNRSGNHCYACIRGLLCFKCNTSLGGFNDEPDLLRKAAAYVESFQTPASPSR